MGREVSSATTNYTTGSRLDDGLQPPQVSIQQAPPPPPLGPDNAAASSPRPDALPPPRPAWNARTLTTMAPINAAPSTAKPRWSVQRAPPVVAAVE